MKIPRTPPNWANQLTELIKDKQVAQKWLVATSELPRNEDYLHWDKLRHLTPPEGLSSEDWWAILKFRRQSNRTVLPLLDKKEEPFHFSLTPTMFSLLHQIDLKAGGSIGSLEEVNPETRDRYYVSSLMEESITSSLLEGAATTRSDAKEFLRSGRKAATEAQRMIINNYRTMQGLVDWKSDKLSIERLLEIHQTITEGTLKKSDQEGRFRDESEKIDVGSDFHDESYHIPPPASELSERVSSMCDFANDPKMDGYLHPVIRAIILHFWLAYDHPFVDGNGRTARALFYWSMLRNEFGLVEFISISRILNAAPVQYYRSFLYTETDDNDLNYFILHQLKVITTAIDDLHRYLERKRREISESKFLLGPELGLNHRQIAVVEKAIREPGFEFKIKNHQTSHNIVYQTARTDLKELASKGILKEVKLGKQFVFIAPPNLIENLKATRPHP